MGKLLAVDLGSKRVGLALSDPSQIIASPFKTLTFKSDALLIEELLDIIAKQQVDRVVIGLPLNENGTQSPGCARVIRFSEKLHSRGIRVEVWDERFSSMEAKQVLKKTGVTGRKAELKIDQIAAAVILRDYLDGDRGDA